MNTIRCLTDEALQELLSAPPEDPAWRHVDDCRECRERWKKLEQSFSPQFLETLQQAAVLLAEQTTSETDRSFPPVPLPEPDYLPDRTGWKTITSRQTVEGYIIGGLIGRGGMGNVFIARRISDGRLAAIKFLHTLRQSGIQRFRQEIRATLDLAHQHLIPAFGGGVTDDVPHLISEFVRGADCGQIAALCGPISTGAACAVADAVLQALSFLHSRHIVHRDIKPSNIMVRDDGQVLLGDFGLISVSSEDLRLASTTATRDILGTPEYMAPEQLSNPRNATPLSDIYGLAATMYRLLAGCSPFFSGSLTDHRQALEARLKNQILPIGRLADIPEPLADLIMAALSGDLSLRPQSAEEFRQRIAPYVDATELPALSLRCIERLREFGFPEIRDDDLRPESVWKGRRRTLMAGAFGAAVMMGLGWMADRLRGGSSAQTSGMDRKTSLSGMPPATPDPLRHLRGFFSSAELKAAALPRGTLAAWTSPRGTHSAGLSCVTAVTENRPMVAGTLDGSLASGDAGTLRLQPMSFRSPWKLPTTQVEYSPDGQHLAALSADGRITLWRHESGALQAEQQESMADREGEEVTLLPAAGRFVPLCRILGDAAVLEHIAWDPAGRYLAAGGWPSILRVWDVSGLAPAAASGAEFATNPFPERQDLPCVLLTTEPTITALAFSRDGTRLLAGTLDGELRLLNPAVPTESSQPLDRQKQHSGRINRIVVSSSNDWFLTCGGWSEDRSIQAWTVAADRLIHLQSWEEHDAALESIALSRDETTLASVDTSGVIQLWRLAFSSGAATEITLSLLDRYQLPLSSGGGPRLSFTADGRRLIVAAGTEALTCLVIEDGQLQQQTDFRDSSQQIRALVPDAEQLQVLVGSSDGSIVQWDLRVSPPRPSAILTSNSEVFSLVQDVGKTVLISSGWSSGDLPVWFRNDVGWESGGVLSGGGDVLFCCTMSSGNTQLAWGGLDGAAVVVPLDEPDRVRLSSNSPAPAALENRPTAADTVISPAAIALSQPGRRFLHPSWVRDVTFSRDGKLLLTACQDQIIRVWPAESSDVTQPIAQFTAKGEFAARVRFDDSTATLVAGMGNGDLVIWRPRHPSIARNTPADLLQNRENFSEPRRLRRHRREILSIAMTSDSKLFAVGLDGLLTEWQLPGGEFLNEWQFPWPLTSVALIHEERYAIVGSDRGTIVILDLLSPEN